jgi:DnaJ-class molecular chaperone
VKVLEYMRQKKEEAWEAAIQEQAKEADHLVAEKCFHKKQMNLIKRTLRATAMEKFAHLDVLGITHVSTAAEVKRAYKNLVVKLHPDKIGQNATFESKDAFNAISDAYKVLKDESSRRKYNQEQGSTGGCSAPPNPPIAVPRDQPSLLWNTIPVGT